MSIAKNNGHCDRCNIQTNNLQGSYFNTEMCCTSCLETEKKHPLYEKAVRVENMAVRAG